MRRPHPGFEPGISTPVAGGVSCAAQGSNPARPLDKSGLTNQVSCGASLAEEERFELSTGLRPYAASNGVSVAAGSSEAPAGGVEPPLAG